MTLWKLRFALEYCRKSRGIQKDQAKRMILNGYKQSKLTILIRKHWRRFSVYKPIPNYLLRELCKCDAIVFNNHLGNASKIVKSWPEWKQKVLG